MSVLQWSTTAADNDDSDAGINYAEGQAPSTLNNSARAAMAEIAKWLKDLTGAIVAGGTSNAITLTTNMLPTDHSQPLMLAFEATATNSAATTVTIDALTSRDIKRADGSALEAGDITSGGIYLIAYEAGIDDYLLLNPTPRATATQAQMETGTATTVYVTPGRQHFHPGHPKCWAMITVAAGIPTLQSSYNITSIADTATGRVTVTIATDFSSANWAPLATCRLVDESIDDSLDARIVTIGAQAAGTVELQCHDAKDSVGLNYADPASWYLVGFGDQA